MDVAAFDPGCLIRNMSVVVYGEVSSGVFNGGLLQSLRRKLLILEDIVR